MSMNVAICNYQSLFSSELQARHLICIPSLNFTINCRKSLGILKLEWPRIQLFSNLCDFITDTGFPRIYHCE